MKRFTHKKAAAVAVTAVLVLGGGGIAYAYFTSGGSGTGSAEVGTSPSDAFTISAAGPYAALLPGNGPQSFDVRVANTTGLDSYIGTVYMGIATYGDSGDAATAAGDDIPGCLASWFTVTPSIDFDEVVPADGNVTSTGLGVDAPTIEMPAASVDQDPCQGASVGIAFSTTGS